MLFCRFKEIVQATIMFNWLYTLIYKHLRQQDDLFVPPSNKRFVSISNILSAAVLYDLVMVVGEYDFKNTKHRTLKKSSVILVLDLLYLL